MPLIAIPRELKTLQEGTYKGEIKGVQKTDRKGFEYLEITVDIPEEQTTIKHSVSFNISHEEGEPKSQLAIVLKKLGVDITATQVDIEQVIGKKFTFMTENRKVGDATYPNIINKTIILDVGM